MNIYIVTSNPPSDKNILSRLLAMLVKGTGWAWGSTPDPKADLNYYFPYLEYKPFSATPTAAWFTHFDEGRPAKERAWQQAAQEVKLRLTAARLYEKALGAIGPVGLTTPPLDFAKFAPRPKNPKSGTIGVDGYVHPGGRKGENMVRKLAQSGFDVQAAGRGWPVPCHDHEWVTIQDFYHSLGVFLCSSTIEGIPMPPLEAMACGVPVVIPKGVGMMDDLPEVDGLYRYERGDYASMERAVGQALERGGDAEALNAAVLGYTAEAWCADHERAFAELLGRSATPGKPGPVLGRDTVGPRAWVGKAGVYYVAYGEPARECAVRAVKSMRKHMPEVEIAVASDRPLGVGEDYFVANPDEDVGGRSVKTKIYDLAPQEWEYVLYLDADTEVVADVSHLFDLMVDGWELAVCINPAQYVLAREMVRPDNKDECAETFKALGTDEALQFNGGVFAFRRSKRVKAFFDRWHQEWQRWGRRDQAALDRALYADPLRVYTLGVEWNTVTRYVDPKRTAGILHYPLSARRWRGILPGRLDSKEAWASVHPVTAELKR